MSRGSRARSAGTTRGAAGTTSRPSPGRPLALWPPQPRVLGAALLLLHLLLAVWVASRNSVTFDENFHLPAGVVALTRADFTTSYAQPPLARELCALAALAAGARPPDPAAERIGDERRLGESFMRRNADRYTRVFMAGRLVTALLSTLLAWLIWRLARKWYGERAGLVALGAWALSPEALAHASVVGVDVPTALVLFGASIAGYAWLRTGRWREWGVCAAWCAAAFLVRFSAVQLVPVLGATALVLAWRGRLAGGPRVLAGLVLLAAVALLAVNAGYRFQGTGVRLGATQFLSANFQALARRWPGVPMPFPRGYLLGLDYLSFLSQAGLKLSYFLGRTRDSHDWRYFPVAIAVKWPLGLLGLLALRVVHRVRVRHAHLERDLVLLIPAAVVLLMAMSANLDYGVRYVLPMLPFACVWMAGAAAGLPGAARKSRPGAWATAALALVVLEGAESARGLPYPLSFFNAAAGGPGRGDRIVNDSNVDWGQGLLALRDEMGARGIDRIQLVYHGTTDPATYGIYYVPFFSGALDSTVEFVAVSSYFMAGLPARLMLSNGSTEPRRYDFAALATLQPVARPANCMYLYKVR